MSGGLARLNAMGSESAREAFLRCCGSTRWAATMTELRPFASPEALFLAAECEWWKLDTSQWLEAFGRHPRIGERPQENAGASTSWARQEQSGAASASERTSLRLRELNTEYEERFGHVYLICATGRTADEMLAILESRLANDADAEMREAAEQQRQITRLRLERLLNE